MSDISKQLDDATDFNEKQVKKSASGQSGAKKHITQNEQRTRERRKRGGPMM